MTPKKIYQQLLDEKKILPDPAQAAAVNSIQRIYTQLHRPQWWRKLLKHPVKGLYCWGPVGVGKTFLMDLLANSLTLPKKRMHFYLFMQYVHAHLKKYQGKKNPLDHIAKKISSECRILLFDEFYVKDIADAMILSGLLHALFRNHVCFFATSNIKPDDLYKEGLQHDSFLPAIAAIKTHCEIHHLQAKQDYRFKALTEKGFYFSPDDEESEVHLEAAFLTLANSDEINYNPLSCFGRDIKIRKRTKQVLWIDFIDLCSVPRAEKDYAALADQFSFIIISHIPKVQAHQHALITNFIQLIDVLYDKKVRVIFSAAAPADQLYTEGKLLTDFKRTRSRLNEMQTEAYVGEIN